jgi:hypothetical protein
MQTGNNHLWACRGMCIASVVIAATCRWWFYMACDQLIDLAAKWIQLNRARWTQPPGPMQKIPRLSETVRSHLSTYWRVYEV